MSRHSSCRKMKIRDHPSFFQVNISDPYSDVDSSEESSFFSIDSSFLISSANFASLSTARRAASAFSSNLSANLFFSRISISFIIVSIISSFSLHLQYVSLSDHAVKWDFPMDVDSH